MNQRPTALRPSRHLRIFFKCPDLQKSSFEGRKKVRSFRIKFARPEKVSNVADVESRKVSEKVSDKYLMVLNAIRANPAISRSKLYKELGEPVSTIVSKLRKLKKDGIIKHVGKIKGGHWEIIKR